MPVPQNRVLDHHRGLAACTPPVPCRVQGRHTMDVTTSQEYEKRVVRAPYRVIVFGPDGQVSDTGPGHFVSVSVHGHAERRQLSQLRYGYPKMRARPGIGRASAPPVQLFVRVGRVGLHSWPSLR